MPRYTNIVYISLMLLQGCPDLNTLLATVDSANVPFNVNVVKTRSVLLQFRRHAKVFAANIAHSRIKTRLCPFTAWGTYCVW